MLEYASKVQEVEARFKYRADRGVKLLVNRYAGYQWVKEIDLGKLDMHNCKDCVLGQLFGDYFVGLNILGIGGGTPYGFMEDPMLFHELGMEYHEQFAILNRVWTEKLRTLV